MSRRRVLVSVVIVNYNYARFLRDAILSVLGQTYSELEMVIVDDGSTDGSREIIELFRNRATVILQENHGPMSAYNAGYAASRGDLVIFLDADDMLRPGAVEEVAAAWQPAAAKVQFSLEITDAAGRSSGAIEPVYPQDYTAEKLRREFADTNSYTWPPTSGNAYSRRFLKQLMPLSQERFRCLDSVLNIVAPLFGDVYTLPKALGCYRIHGDNMWALHGFSQPRIRNFLTLRLCEIDYLRRVAAQRGVALSASNPLDHCMTMLRYRLVVAKLDHDRSVSGGRPLRLCLRAARCLSLTNASAAWRASELLWFVSVSLSFGGVARWLIEWRFDRSTRPLWINRLIDRSRSRAAALGLG
jgi:hypothetical protein